MVSMEPAETIVPDKDANADAKAADKQETTTLTPEQAQNVKLHRLAEMMDKETWSAFLDGDKSLDIKMPGTANLTALHAACSTGNAPLVEHLLKCGFDPNARTLSMRHTPLHKLIIGCSYPRRLADPRRCLTLLLEHKADPAWKDFAGADAIVFARRSQQLALHEMLLKQNQA